MRLIDKLSKPHRIVVVIAIGLGLWEVGRYLVRLRSFLGLQFGSPSNAHYFITAGNGGPTPSTGLPALARLIIWLALIGLWALAAAKVLEEQVGSHMTDELDEQRASDLTPRAKLA